MRRKRSWVVWCVVVVVALLALAAPGLQAQSKPGTEYGKCTVATQWLNYTVDIDAKITRYYRGDDPIPYKVVCRGELPEGEYDPSTLPMRGGPEVYQYDFYCRINAEPPVTSLDWIQSISKKGNVTLTCYRQY